MRRSRLTALETSIEVSHDLVRLKREERELAFEQGRQLGFEQGRQAALREALALAERCAVAGQAAVRETQ